MQMSVVQARASLVNFLMPPRMMASMLRWRTSSGCLVMMSQSSSQRVCFDLPSSDRNVSSLTQVASSAAASPHRSCLSRYAMYSSRCPGSILQASWHCPACHDMPASLGHAACSQPQMAMARRPLGSSSMTGGMHLAISRCWGDGMQSGARHQRARYSSRRTSNIFDTHERQCPSGFPAG